MRAEAGQYTYLVGLLLLLRRKLDLARRTLGEGEDLMLGATRDGAIEEVEVSSVELEMVLVLDVLERRQ